jgi:hypothetical protein
MCGLISANLLLCRHGFVRFFLAELFLLPLSGSGGRTHSARLGQTATLRFASWVIGWQRGRRGTVAQTDGLLSVVVSPLPRDQHSKQTVTQDSRAFRPASGIVSGSVRYEGGSRGEKWIVHHRWSGLGIA